MSRRVASRPERPGMLRSITTTSGSVSSTLRMADSPFETSATTSMPFSRSIRARPAR